MPDEFILDDPLLIALRDARPTLDDADLSADSPTAVLLLEKILELPSASSVTRRDRPGLRLLESRTGSRWSRTRLVLALVVVAAVVFVAVAVARSLGGFSGWLTGQPGAPASTAEQRAFDRATRSWVGFPRGTKLRLLAETSVGGATYTLYGFRAAGALCLRLVVTGNQSDRQLACPPLSLLRSTRSPALVAVAEDEVGLTQSHNPVQQLLVAPEALVTFGIVADGVNTVELADNDATPQRAIVSGDAFLWVNYMPPFGQHLSNVWAVAGGRRAAIPFTPRPLPFGWAGSTAPALSPHGPDKAQRTIVGGTIGWLIHHRPVGASVPKTIHRLYPRGTTVLYEREVAPDPAAPERIVVGLIKPPYPAGVTVGQQICATVVGGRFPGAPYGCWYATQLFTTGPNVYGSNSSIDNNAVTTPNAPFNWALGNQQGSIQYSTIAGLTSDAVVSMRLYLGTGQTLPIPVHDNAYIVEAPSDGFPVRLVAYDTQHRVIGVVTVPSQALPPPLVRAASRSEPAPNAHWHLVLDASAGEIFSAPSATGGTCFATEYRDGGGTLSCGPQLPSDALRFGSEGDSHEVTVSIQAGAAVKHVTIHYANGRSQTLTTKHGVSLARLPSGAMIRSHRPLSFFARLGITRITGLNAKGQVIASKR